MIAASVKDSERLVEFLLSKGADPNEKSEVPPVSSHLETSDLPYIADNTGQTVVHFVASKNNIDIARRLFENQPPASARIRDRRGQVRLAALCILIDTAPRLG